MKKAMACRVKYVNNKKILYDVIKEWDDSESGWTAVNNEKRKPNLSIKENNSGKVLKAAKSKRTWHLFVENLERGMSAIVMIKTILDWMWSGSVWLFAYK